VKALNFGNHGYIVKGGFLEGPSAIGFFDAKSFIGAKVDPAQF